MAGLEVKGRSVSASVTMYSTVWCGYCVRLKRHMEREGIAYAEIDIEQEPDGARLVERVNGGNRVVPTVVVRTGGNEDVALSNPSVQEIKAAISAV
jgi:mycoredoxin